MDKYEGVHSCGPTCQQPLCVANRRVRELEATITRYRKTLEAIAAESEMKIPTGNGWTYTYSEMAAKALEEEVSDEV